MSNLILFLLSLPLNAQTQLHAFTFNVFLLTPSLKISNPKTLSLKMATNLIQFRPFVVGAYAAGNGKSDLARRKSSSTNWFTPLFGWSSEPDYIDSKGKSESQEKPESGSSEADAEQKSSRSRFVPGCFTEEKAKQLRLMTTGTDSFHDAMYHSAIASRLASDFKNRSDP